MFKGLPGTQQAQKQRLSASREYLQSIKERESLWFPQAKDWLEDVLGQNAALTDQEVKILYLRCAVQLIDREIGDVLGVCKQRVGKVLRRATNKLKGAIEDGVS